MIWNHCKTRVGLLAILVIVALALPDCSAPQTRYESQEDDIVEVPRAPAGTPRIKIALVNFANRTGQDFLVAPATSQLTSMMVNSGYFEVIEPSLVESVIRTQSDITEEKLAILQERYGAQYFLTGTLTNFEIRETSTGFCILFGLLGSSNTREYIVETGIDYRLVTVPNASIVAASGIENRRTDTSEASHILFSGGGSNTRVLRSSGGKLLRYAMRDLIEDMLDKLPSQ